MSWIKKEKIRRSNACLPACMHAPAPSYVPRAGRGQTDRQTKQTDTQTDGQTDGQTGRKGGSTYRGRGEGPVAALVGEVEDRQHPHRVAHVLEAPVRLLLQHAV